MTIDQVGKLFSYSNRGTNMYKAIINVLQTEPTDRTLQQAIRQRLGPWEPQGRDYEVEGQSFTDYEQRRYHTSGAVMGMSDRPCSSRTFQKHARMSPCGPIAPSRPHRFGVSPVQACL